MRRWLVLLFAVLLPLQFAWSAASAYCQHESAGVQSQHLGHHAHEHQGEPKKTSGNSPLAADADCAACHATGVPLIVSMPNGAAFTRLPMAVASRAMPPFSSALARAPDRPQWLRLV